MAYIGVNLETSISIKRIYSIHYFEYMSDFSFPGEFHNFWEFICVDRGEVGIIAGHNSILLKKGEIAFHQPNEFHAVRATGSTAPNLVVVSFECHDSAMDFFRGKILKIDDLERSLLANIIAEAKDCFDCRLDDPYLQNMPMKTPSSFGAEQIILNHLEHFLIHLIRRYSDSSPPSLASGLITKSTAPKSSQVLFNLINDYLEQRLCEQVTIEQICHDNLIGRSKLQKVFKEHTGMGVIEYFSYKKIITAKELIRAKHMNFTQISEHLGYTSIHYFSRKFKKLTGMTPSEYASSIKAMADGKF